MTPDRPRPGLAARLALALALALALVLAFAALAAGRSARYGIHEDAMLSYAVALRHLEGQLPYRDYVVPHGPLAGALITPFFWLPVTGGWAFVIATAALNAAAALVVWKVVERVTGDWVMAALAGVATGAWFLTAFGAYYHDYVSYFLALLAVWAYFAVPHAGWRAALAGLALALAYHAKQTFGASAALAFALADVAFAGRRDGVLLNRRLLPFVAGYLGGHGLVLAGLAACGGLGNWWFSSV